MNSFFVAFLIVASISLIYLIIDYFLVKKWIGDTTKSIENILNGLKAFIMVSIIDRITDAITETEPDSESDESDGTES